jgi:hypothetical protein
LAKGGEEGFYDQCLHTRLSPESDWFFIIERILEFGDIDDLKWMKKTFTAEQIRETVGKSRVLTRRTLSFCKASGYAP